MNDVVPEPEGIHRETCQLYYRCYRHHLQPSFGLSSLGHISRSTALKWAWIVRAKEVALLRAGSDVCRLAAWLADNDNISHDDIRMIKLHFNRHGIISHNDSSGTGGVCLGWHLPLRKRFTLTRPFCLSY